MENNEVNVNEGNQSGISLRLLWDVLKRCWYWMLLGAVLMGGLSLWYFNRSFVQQYSSSSYFYISNVATTTSLYSSAQIDGAESMAEVISKVVPTSDELADRISTVLATGEYSGKVSEGAVQDMISAANGDVNHLTTLIQEKINNAVNAKANKTKTVTKEQVQRMITASNDGAVLKIKISGPDAELNYYVAMAMEDWLPRYCDDVNNQPDAMSLTHESKTMKVIQKARKGDLENSHTDVYRYPLFITVFVAVAIYGVFLLVVIMNTTVYSAADIKAISPKFSVIGSIEHWSLEEEKKWGRRAQRDADRLGTHVDQKLILREKAPFRVQEGFHELRTNVTFCAAGEKGCVVGVASSIAGSGKSFVMANLAVSLSKLYDKKILLVDGDMRRPMIHKIFSVPNKVGLSNLLAGMDIAEADLKHSYDRLDVITSGTLPPNPIDLLSSPRMKEILKKWKEEYDYILIDLPPVGEVADMFAISDEVSGYIYVVRSGFTDSRILRDTTDTITSKNAKIYGYVVTDVHPERTEGYTKYGHYYRYYKYGHYNRYKSYSSYSSYASAAEGNSGNAESTGEAEKTNETSKK